MSTVVNSDRVLPTASVSAPLSDEAKAKLELKKSKAFRATIAMCVVYGVAALLVLLACALSETGRAVLIDAAAPFTITLLGGMALVITFVGIAVFKYEPAAPDILRTDGYACPDYFELERVPASELARFPEKHRSLMAYRCKARVGLLDDSATTSTPSIFTTANSSGGLKDVVGDVNSTLPSASRMTCGQLYPLHLDARDRADNKDDPTKYRCAYINTTSGCSGLTWSSVCPRHT
jgi:hypothetical protein